MFQPAINFSFGIEKAWFGYCYCRLVCTNPTLHALYLDFFSAAAPHAIAAKASGMYFGLELTPGFR